MTQFVELVLETTGLTQLLNTFNENDIDDEILRKLPDCAAGSLEERLFATVVPSVGHRLKIVGAIREVSCEGVNNYNCSICSNSFRSFKLYWDHVKDFHEIGGSRARINCPLCSMTFTNLNNLRKHIQANICPKLPQVFHTVAHPSKAHVDNLDSVELTGNFPPRVLQDIFTDYKFSFLKSLQMSGSIPLAKSAEILRATNSLINSIVDIAKRFVETELSEEQLILKMNTLKDPFTNYNSSQYQIEKSLKENHILVDCQEVRLGSHFKYDKAAGTMREKWDNLYYFQLSETLPIILQKYKEVSNFTEGEIGSELIRNFKCAKFYSKFSGQPLALQIYYDNIEICNPLGAKAKIHKLAMFYFTISNFPSHLKSQLATIFPLLVVKTKFVKEYGINLILKPIVVELNKLHSAHYARFLLGTPFTHVSLLQICGDNLGLHLILGFTEGFNANFRCRFCKATKEQTYTAIEEQVHLRRTFANYKADIEIKNLSLTGIREPSEVNNIRDFHVTQNYAPDIMHDIFEGICIIELKVLLKYVLENSLSTLKDLNHRISCCIKKNSHDLAKFPEIGQTFIDGDKKSCFSASEMNNLFLVFPAIFGDIFDSEDKYWVLVLKLRRLIRILMAPIITKSSLPFLKFLIAEHHQMYLDLTENKLTPKFHHLLHYPHAIEQLGPQITGACGSKQSIGSVKLLGRIHTTPKILRKRCPDGCL